MSENPLSERFKAANDAISEHCFKTGRLKYEIELDEEAVEKKKLEYRNMRIDFDKLRKEFVKCQEDMARAQRVENGHLSLAKEPAQQVQQ